MDSMVESQDYRIVSGSATVLQCDTSGNITIGQSTPANVPASDIEMESEVATLR